MIKKIVAVSLFLLLVFIVAIPIGASVTENCSTSASVEYAQNPETTEYNCGLGFVDRQGGVTFNTMGWILFIGSSVLVVAAATSIAKRV